MQAPTPSSSTKSIPSPGLLATPPSSPAMIFPSHTPLPPLDPSQLHRISEIFSVSWPSDAPFSQQHQKSFQAVITACEKGEWKKLEYDPECAKTFTTIQAFKGLQC